MVQNSTASVPIQLPLSLNAFAVGHESQRVCTCMYDLRDKIKTAVNGDGDGLKTAKIIKRQC